jgi:hypothetical protein
VAYNFQTGSKKIKLLMEYVKITQKCIFGNAVLAALMYEVQFHGPQVVIFCSYRSEK